MGGVYPGDAGGFRGGYPVGSRVAGYRLEGRIGAGGMAVVFRAVDERLGRRVALKVLVPALATDEAFRHRFIRESRAATAVNDPHIIPVYEAGEADGVLFIAMRYVPGGDLRTVLRTSGSLSPERACAIISPVAAALDSAHDAGLVHRDVKPANILVDVQPGRPDHVYLSDWGLSKGALSTTGLTGSGQFLGSVEYVSPEQIQGKPVDGRTDQYALACSAFELLTGTPPFHRNEVMAVLYAKMSLPPPLLTAQRPDLPPAADQVFATALARAPEDRYPNCRAFADALRDALGLAPYLSRPTVDRPKDHPGTEIAQPIGSARASTVGQPEIPVPIRSAPATQPPASGQGGWRGPVPPQAVPTAGADASAGTPAAIGSGAGRNGSGAPGGVADTSKPGKDVTRRRALLGATGLFAVAGLATGGWELSREISSAPRSTPTPPPVSHTSQASHTSQQPTPQRTVLTQAPGEEIWSFPAPGPVQAGPVVANGAVYAADDNTAGDSSSHNVYAFNGVTGAMAWKFANGGEIYSGMAVSGDFVYVGSDFHNVYGLRVSNGAMAWRYVTGDLVSSTPAVAYGNVYIGSDDGKIYALNAATGRELWSYKTNGTVQSWLGVSNNIVYAGSGDGIVYAVSAANGQRAWSYSTGGPVLSELTVANGVVYAGSDDNNIYALNAATGGELWNFPTGGAVESGIAVANGVVYAGSSDQKIYALNAATGKELWSFPTGGAVYSGIAVANGVVYAGSNDRNIYALNAATGKELWSYTTNGKVLSQIAVAGGIVYAGSGDPFATSGGKLYAVRA